ncbi:hypothetical protein IAI18_22300 [Acetobacteraceae bacterium H6797]|nr:hypothetical protein [Acetobacteraceae bacterium H6797]
MYTRLLLAVLAAMALPLLARAETPCDGIWQQSLSEGRALIEDERVRAAFRQWEDEKRVYEHMALGPWHIVWVAWSISEPGAIFIRRDADGPRFLGGWGGVALPDEGDEVKQWAKSEFPGIPEPLVNCFVWYALDGRLKGAPTWPNPFNDDWDRPVEGKP